MARYIVVEHLHDGAVFTLDRARDAEGGGRVVLKRLPAGRSEPVERARLRREFEILRRLDVPGVVRARALEEDAGELLLVLEDFGGATLDARLRRGPLTPEEFVDLAIQLADIVDRVHRSGVLHKDIKPRNILLDDAGRVQLIDFGIASEAPRELAVAAPPQVLEGTLAYIAPEQTGRISRPVDARSDLYSLGATLYEALTLRPPFVASDPVELVHCHIARAPVAPGELRPDAPAVLSDIILKLLAKEADDRYQSASGLRHDLERCREQMAAGQRPERFPLATRDAPVRFELPARLYGREAALLALSGAHARARAGGAALVLIAGPAGIGKSAVIGESARELAGAGGRMLAGKFDQQRRDRPYSALRQAFGQVAEDMLAEPDESLARRRVALERALGRLRGALVELVPEFAAIVGKPAAAAAVEGETPVAVKGRLHRAVRALVGALADPSAPLVLVLDDLQWADAASLELLAALLGPPRIAGLLVVATVRDGAPSPGLRAVLEDMSVASALTRIDLAPLTEEDTRALCADALRCAPAEAAPLAALVHDRTGGVPLLVGEFLRDLAGHDLLTFDAARGRWTWDTAAIAGAAVSADVVAIMVERTRSLGQAAREALGRAAVLGGEFDAALLAGLSGRTEAEVEAALVAAARSGLVVPRGGRFRFFHDRVQQAIAATLGDDDLRAIHLAIGRLLRGDRPVDAEHPRLFEIAEHLNAAAPLITAPAERRELAALDLAAARRARASGAFAAVAGYAGAGVDLLGPGGAEGEAELLFELRLLRAEGLFLAGEPAAAEAVLRDMLERASDPTERALVCELWGALDQHVGRIESALERGLAGLAALGLELPRRIGLPGVMLEFMRTRAVVGRRSPRALIELPALTDPQVRLELRLFQVATAAAYQLDPMTMLAMTMRTTRLSLQHGLSSMSAAQFLSYGMMLGIVTRDPLRMQGYGELGLALLERFPSRSAEGVVKMLYGVMIVPWTRPVMQTLPMLREAYHASVDAGQLVYAAISLTGIVSHRIYAGSPLEQVRQDIESALTFAREAGLWNSVVHFVQLGEFIGELTGVRLPDAGAPSGHDDALTAGARAIWREMTEFAMGRFEAGLAETDRAEAGSDAVAQTLLITEHVFVRAMLLAIRGALPGPLGKLRLRRAVEACARRLEQWAALCPANHEARARLVRAELLRLQGDGVGALRGYEAAIEAAVTHGRPHDEAYACEAAARLLAATGATDAERLYLRRARRAFLRWGASARVQQIDREHAGLERRSEFDVLRDSSLHGPRTSAGTTHSLQLDYASLFKATQVFAEELALDRLLSAVMRLVVENAGAERGVLLLERADGLHAVHEYVVTGDQHRTLAEVPLAELGTVAASMVLLAHRGGRPVVVDDATRDVRLADDPHVRRARPRSLLVAPLVHGRERLGALYLENNLATGVFTPDRAETLHLLAVQAAIAIDRALLFGRVDEARRAAEAASVAKTRFLANMSHELRTPLNAILGYCELVAEEAEAQGASEILGDVARIRHAGTHLLGIVRDILDLTKLESDELTVAREPIDVAAMLADVAASLSHEIERRGNRLTRAWGEEAGQIVGDPTLLRQALQQLLGNAAKFTEGGEIVLRARRVAPDRLRVDVEDSGIGMSEAELAAAFEPFAQADASSTRRYGGVGLGLTICRKIALALGGTLTASSERGRGSVFSLELPAQPPAARAS